MYDRECYFVAQAAKKPDLFVLRIDWDSGYDLDPDVDDAA